MIYYILSIFLSAFLLFQVQPMIARYILPWFGGTPGVWSTVELFFQVFLTGGYTYAAWLVRRVPRKLQGRIHLALLVASLIAIALVGVTGLDLYYWNMERNGLAYNRMGRDCRTSPLPAAPASAHWASR